MPMWIGQEEAIAALGEERLAPLAECVDSAWAVYEETFMPEVPVCSGIGQANILHELVAQQAREQLDTEEGFRIHDRTDDRGRFLVTVDGQITLQFKKLTADLLTRNNQTETSRAFDLQEPELDGIPNYPRLTVGWVLGQYRTSLSEVYLVFAIGDDVQWHYDLRSGEGSISLELVRPDGPSPAEQEAALERRKDEDDGEAREDTGVAGE